MRNPNLGVVSAAAASDHVAAIVDRRGIGDPELTGARPAWWWTGKAPQKTPGWVAGAEAHLTSLAPLSLAECSREEAMAYFDNTWTLTDLLFALLQGEASFYLQPYHHLRLPLIFYYGHAAALYVNKLRLAGLLDKPIDAHFELLFETGVDEMSWDDTHQSSTLWPAVREFHLHSATLRRATNYELRNAKRQTSGVTRHA